MSFKITPPIRDIRLGELIRLTNASSHMKDDVLAFERSVDASVNVSEPFRIDGLLMLLVREGEGTLGVDLKQYDVKPNTIIVIQPQNYVYLSDVRKKSLSDVLICSRKIVQEVLPKLTDLLPLIIHHRTQPVTPLSDTDAEKVHFFFKLIQSHLEQEDTPFRTQKVMCLLQAALFELMDIHQRRTEQQAATVRHTRREEIMAKFIMLVSEGFRTNRQVSHYAERLSITPKHLSTVVREISGRTAGQWIENFVIMEAKVLLRTTDLTIQGIASQLSFANQSFFGKYFRYQTGMSPSQYRRTDHGRMDIFNEQTSLPASPEQLGS